MTTPFRDRISAGRQLAQALEKYRERERIVVLALPRGGVSVAAEVARSLNAELDLMIVRKLGLPGQEELAMGAIAIGGTRILNKSVIDSARVNEASLETVTERESRELERRQRAYRGERPWPDLQGATVILVDDGIATGATMRAALGAVKQEGAREVVVAVPVAPAEEVTALQDAADEVICLQTPPQFGAIGRWYRDFSQVSDDEVRDQLKEFWSA
ncbi:phosphoribosyltransferase [Kineobactrum sediminis]|uniref:Phosphoribosyltransferase n=1 Tax=Kineobactrum sediminis TaxID=1905677 RepID=A0A2N5Y1U3_9GAMM|nr:phosphoribosyltransferase family protein [Kineobactrum sediminis]PLW82366.1 phosphoribosyltransferase [Kineobactrum sediminis]